MATGAGTFSAFVVWQKTASLVLRNSSRIRGVLRQNVLRKPVNDSEYANAAEPLRSSLCWRNF